MNFRKFFIFIFYLLLFNQAITAQNYEDLYLEAFGKKPESSWVSLQVNSVVDESKQARPFLIKHDVVFGGIQVDKETLLTVLDPYIQPHLKEKIQSMPNSVITGEVLQSLGITTQFKINRKELLFRLPLDGKKQKVISMYDVSEKEFGQTLTPMPYYLAFNNLVGYAVSHSDDASLESLVGRTQTRLNLKDFYLESDTLYRSSSNDLSWHSARMEYLAFGDQILLGLGTFKDNRVLGLSDNKNGFGLSISNNFQGPFYWQTKIENSLEVPVTLKQDGYVYVYRNHKLEKQLYLLSGEYIFKNFHLNVGLNKITIYFAEKENDQGKVVASKEVVVDDFFLPPFSHRFNYDLGLQNQPWEDPFQDDHYSVSFFHEYGFSHAVVFESLGELSPEVGVAGYGSRFYVNPLYVTTRALADFRVDQFPQRYVLAISPGNGWAQYERKNLKSEIRALESELEALKRNQKKQKKSHDKENLNIVIAQKEIALAELKDKKDIFFLRSWLSKGRPQMSLMRTQKGYMQSEDDISELTFSWVQFLMGFYLRANASYQDYASDDQHRLRSSLGITRHSGRRFRPTFQLEYNSADESELTGIVQVDVLLPKVPVYVRNRYRLPEEQYQYELYGRKLLNEKVQINSAFASSEEYTVGLRYQIDKLQSTEIGHQQFGDTQRRFLSYDNRSDYGLYSSRVEFSQSGDQDGSLLWRSNMRNAVVFTPKGWTVSQYIPEGFTFYESDPGLKNATVRVPSRIGTAPFSKLAVPNYLGYRPYSIRVEVDNQPVGFDVGSGLYSITPAYRKGYFVKIGEGQKIMAITRVLDEKGNPLAHHYFKLISKSNPKKEAILFTSGTGRLQLLNLTPGTYFLQDLDNQFKSYEITVSKDLKTTLWKMDDIRLRRK